MWSGLLGLPVLVLGVIAVLPKHRTTDDHLVSIVLTGSVARVAQAESAFYARHGRFTANRDSLAALVPFLSDTFINLRFERADPFAWRVVASPRGRVFECAASGAVGLPPVTFAALHKTCIQP